MHGSGKGEDGKRGKGKRDKIKAMAFDGFTPAPFHSFLSQLVA